MTYKVIRFYFNGSRPFVNQKRKQKIIKRGLTLEEARSHCAVFNSKPKQGNFRFDGWMME